jgi:acetyl esterase
MATQSLTLPVVEPAAEAIVDATSNPPLVFELGVDGAGSVLEDPQAAPIVVLAVDEQWVIVPAAVGDVPVRLVFPPGAKGPLPAILSMRRMAPRQSRDARPARPRELGSRGPARD